MGGGLSEWLITLNRLLRGTSSTSRMSSLVLVLVHASLTSPSLTIDVTLVVLVVLCWARIWTPVRVPARGACDSTMQLPPLEREILVVLALNLLLIRTPDLVFDFDSSCSGCLDDFGFLHFNM